MVLHLAGRGLGVSPALRRRIEAKIAKVERVLPRIVEARVALETERHRRLAEVTLQAKGATFHVAGAAADFQGALDEALARLVEQVRRRRQRVVGRKKPRPSRRPAGRRAPGPPPPDPAADGALVVRRANPKPMSLEEAVEQLRLRRDGLLVFRNARTRAVNVLRRQPDGTVELVEPGG